MKTRHADKTGSQLLLAEAELRQRLLEVLPRIERTGELLFLNSHNLPHGYRLKWLPDESDELYDIAVNCLSLRKQCSMHADDSIAKLFVAACAESSDITNSHRRGPRQLATWLLDRIQQLDSP